MPLVDVYHLSNIFFPFFSVIATLFDIDSCILKLKDFNCSNSFVPFLFIKLGHLGYSLTSHMEIVWSDAYIYVFGQHDHYTDEFIDSFRICVSLIALFSNYDTTFMFFLNKWLTINIWVQLEFMMTQYN